MKPSQGVYVRNPAEELYAILSIESHRSKTIIMGEDLGTVPSYVRPAMARHGWLGMYVAQFEFTGNSLEALRTVPANTVASVNTHDTPPFKRFWQGLDIHDRQEMGLLDETGVRQAVAYRQSLKQALGSFLEIKGYIKGSVPEEMKVLKATLSFLGVSPAPMVVVNLEDLWLESEPQNVPGTREERPNWRHKADYPFEVFSRMSGVVETLQELNYLRRHLKRDEMVRKAFSLNAPEATSVALVGDCNNWDPNVQLLRPGKSGIWRGSVRLSPGVYPYKFVVDGSEWREDPLNPNRVPNAYGSFNSICEVI